MRVELSAEKVAFPRHCVCCGRSPETELAVSASRSRGKKVVRTTTHTWTVPYCGTCAGHVAQWNRAHSAVTAGLIGGIVLGALVGLASCGAGFVVMAAAVVGGFVFQAVLRSGITKSCSAECACASVAAQFVGWDGRMQVFDFVSRGYAAAFLDANASKLVNVSPEARQLLEASLQQRQAVLEHARTEAEHRLADARSALAEANSRSAEAQDAHDHAKWIARIEAAKGPAGRRTALAAALAATERADLRDQLKLEASRIEVQAALDKADALKSPAAKLRTLRATLDAIRADDVPDELQADQIRWLEEAIAELERGS